MPSTHKVILTQGQQEVLKSYNFRCFYALIYMFVHLIEY